MAFKMKGFTYAAGTGGAKKMKTAVFQKKEEEFKTYRKAYEDADKSKYKTYEEFEKAAKDYNKKTYGTTEPSKAVNEINKVTGGSSTKEDLAKAKKKVDAGKGAKLTTGPKTVKGADAKKPISAPTGKKPKISNEKLVSSKTVDIKNPRSNKKTVVMDKQREDGTSVKVKDKFKKGKSGATINTSKRSGDTENVRKYKYKAVEKDAQGNRVSVTKTTKKYDKEGNETSKRTKTRKAFGQTKVGKFLSGKKKKKDDSSMKNYKKGYYKK